MDEVLNNESYWEVFVDTILIYEIDRIHREREEDSD